jgi:formylmethanofuran dehydrogenase subunit B
VHFVEDATCTYCGCSCDDIMLTVDGTRIVVARNACALGESWFFSHPQPELPACLVDGQPASLDLGYDRAARILADARYPLIFGLAHTTCEAQRVAVAIGDWIGGCVDATASVCDVPFQTAFQEVGQVTCTLGEIKNRADLIIFWSSDPEATHPRHFARFSLTATGTFVPHGRADRYCVVVDNRKTATACQADRFIAITPGKDFEALWTLRALVKGIELDANEVSVQTGVPLAVWQELVDHMKRARYGALFFGMSLPADVDRHLTSHAVLSLVRDLNAHARFVCQVMRGGGNATGADNVLTWQTGYPGAVNLARGYPRSIRGEYTANQALEYAEADAALIVGHEPAADLSDAARAHLERIPCVVVGSRATNRTRVAEVAFATATYGINTAGTVHRMDGVPIPLRPAAPSPLPADQDILKAIERRIRELNVSAQS